MMVLSTPTLQIIGFVCNAILFVLFVVAVIFFLRFMMKWTKVADLLNRKMEGGWKFFDASKLVAFKGVVAMALPYLMELFKKVSGTENKQTKTKK